MSWSGIRKRAKEFLCPALAKRIDYHITSYHRDSENRESGAHLGRGWITVDGEEVLSFSGKAAQWKGGGSSETEDRQVLFEVIRDYPDTSIEDALQSESFVTRGLAMLDRRVGKRKLAGMKIETEHPFVQLMHGLRCEAENILPTLIP